MPTKKFVVPLLALVLALGACGGDGGETDAGSTDADAPQSIVSISPTATEMLFAIGAGAQVKAVDDQSDYPTDAPKKEGLSGFTPNVEAIVGYEPDLVVLSNDTNDVVAGLKAAGVETLLLPAAKTLEESYAQIEQLGEATGHEDEATEVVEEMKDEIEDLVGDLPERAEPLTYYHELDNTFFTATSKTFLGEVYALAGLENIADAADSDQSGYPQLSPEYIIEKNPDLVFLADTLCCQQSAETVAARPGWKEIKAVQQGHVVALDDDIASRWGPRVVELLRVVAKAVADVPAA
jgi:iron complex transport system substrate-binding protein